jgi:hypothetical protein
MVMVYLLTLSASQAIVWAYSIEQDDEQWIMVGNVGYLDILHCLVV